MSAADRSAAPPAGAVAAPLEAGQPSRQGQQDVDGVRAAIDTAPDVSAAIAAAGRIRTLPGKLLADGVGAEAITGVITTLNDLVTRRLVELTGARAALAAAGACWIALGSAGRGEQTLATDQDNAIIFADCADPEARRAALVPAAAAVNRALDACGIALCRGEIMAGNARWCLSETEWRERFGRWLDEPEPRALLNAAIFFDLRAVDGEHAHAAALRDWLAARAPDAGRFLLLLAQNALGNAPPLGLVRDFVVARGGEHPGTLDLKVNGVQPFVEAARVLALAAGVTATNTPERLAQAAGARGIPAQEAEAWRGAFGAIQRLRLRLNETQHASGTPFHNHLDPATLDDLERRSLKAALRQARSLQGRLARDLSVRGTGFGA